MDDIDRAMIAILSATVAIAVCITVCITVTNVTAVRHGYSEVQKQGSAGTLWQAPHR